MRHALIDHSTLSSVQRLVGDAPTYSPESVDGDITALEGFIQGILFWDKQFWIDDYKESLRDSRSRAYPFMQCANDLPGFDRQAFIGIAEGFTRKFLGELGEYDEFPEPDAVKTLLERIGSGVSVNWNRGGRTSEYFLSIRLIQSVATPPIDKYGVAQSAFYALTQKPGSAFLLEGSVLNERLWSELSELAESLNWLASRTSYYSAVGDALGLELILHPIRHDFRLRLLEKLFPTNPGLFDSVFEKLSGSAKDTISKVFTATDPVIAKLNLPLFTSVLAARTGDPRKFIIEAQHMAQEGAFVEARRRLTEIEELTVEPKGMQRFRKEVNKLLRELDKTAEKILSTYGVETPQGIPVSSVIKLLNLALKPTGIALPDLAGGSVIPIPGATRGRNFGAVYRSILAELATVAKLGQLHRCIRSRIELVDATTEEDQMMTEWTRGRKVSWMERPIKETCSPERPSPGGHSNSANAAILPAPALRHDLDQARKHWSIEDIEMMSYIEECRGIQIIFVPWRCSHCRNEMIVFHAGAFNPDPSSMLDVTSYMYWPDILSGVEEARKKLGLPRMGAIKARPSKTLGSKYMSQGCAECDEPVDQIEMWEYFITICSEGGVFGNTDFKHKFSPSWPPEGFEEVAEQIRAEYAEDD